jgi:hypothetical protein
MQKFIEASRVHVYQVDTMKDWQARREAARRRADGEPEPKSPILKCARDAVSSGAPRAPSIREVFCQAA